jgi:hypothetical protein
MKEIILKSSIDDWSKPYFKRFKKTKYSYLQWTDGNLDRFQAYQLSQQMIPMLKYIGEMFDKNIDNLQRTSSLSNHCCIGHWSGVPNDLADIVELLILGSHKKYMDERKPTKISDLGHGW